MNRQDRYKCNARLLVGNLSPFPRLLTAAYSPWSRDLRPARGSDKWSLKLGSAERVDRSLSILRNFNELRKSNSGSGLELPFNSSIPILLELKLGNEIRDRRSNGTGSFKYLDSKDSAINKARLTKNTSKKRNN